MLCVCSWWLAGERSGGRGSWGPARGRGAGERGGSLQGPAQTDVGQGAGTLELRRDQLSHFLGTFLGVMMVLSNFGRRSTEHSAASSNSLVAGAFLRGRPCVERGTRGSRLILARRGTTECGDRSPGEAKGSREAGGRR